MERGVWFRSSVVSFDVALLVERFPGKSSGQIQRMADDFVETEMYPEIEEKLEEMVCDWAENEPGFVDPDE